MPSFRVLLQQAPPSQGSPLSSKAQPLAAGVWGEYWGVSHERVLDLGTLRGDQRAKYSPPPLRHIVF